MGKRIKWFDNEEIELIRHKNFDFSVVDVCHLNIYMQSFDKPPSFNSDLSNLKTTLLKDSRYKLSDIKKMFPEEVEKRMTINLKGLAQEITKNDGEMSRDSH